MGRLAFVDTPDAVAAARERGAGRIVTDNPRLASIAGIENVEAALDQDAANRIGAAAIALALAVDEAVAAADLGARAGAGPHRPRLAGLLSRFAGGVMHRAAALSRALATGGADAIEIFVVEAPADAPGDPLAPPRFHCPHVELAPLGFFGARPVRVSRVGAAPREAALAEVPASVLRRLLPLPGAVVLHEIADRVARRLKLDRLRRGPILVIGHEVESLRETLPALVRAGFRLRRAGPILASIPADAPGLAADADAAMRAALRPILDRAIGDSFAFTSSEAASIAELLLVRIGRAFAGLAAAWPEQRRRVETVFAGAAPVFLTGGLFGPRGALLRDALAERGIAVVDFEHGVTTGLSAHSQAKIDFSEAATADVLLVCAENAAAAFAAARSGAARRHAIGLADQTRRLHRPGLQRRLARRALGIGAGESVILHVETWLHSGNMRPGTFTPTETAVVEHERRLLEDVYAGLPHRVVYKPYPAQRFPYQPGAAELVATAANIVHAPPEDLRYMRAVADVVVTASPTSTFGWVLGTGVPVIWLDSAKVNPLIDPPWRVRFRDSFLTVDLDAADWPRRLREILSQPIAAIAGEWRGRAAARTALLSEAVFGPEGAVGPRAAAIVQGVLAARTAAPAVPPAAHRPELAEPR
jgi:hypothetical protein